MKHQSPQPVGDGARPGPASVDNVRVEAFDPDQFRPWRFHNRRGYLWPDASLRPKAVSRFVRPPAIYGQRYRRPH